MGSASKSIFCGVLIKGFKRLSGTFTLIASDSNSDDVSILATHCQFKNRLRRFYSEVPYGIEDPEHRHSEITLSAFPSALDALKQRLELLLSPVDHAHRDVHLGVHHALCLEALDHAVRDQLEVIGG
jgi:hypothetical protein